MPPTNYPSGVTGNEPHLTGEPQPWEWQCKDCEAIFDEAELVHGEGARCPECGSEDLSAPEDF